LVDYCGRRSRHSDIPPGKRADLIDLLSLHDHRTQQDRRYTQRYVESETSELLLYHHFLNSHVWLPGENFRKRMTLFDA
jgi:hypothetical protein